MTLWDEALVNLEALGYTVAVDGDSLRYNYRRGNDPPGREKITPLLEILKAHKAEVVEILSSQNFEVMFKKALEGINSKYISGAIPYIKLTHPHLWQHLVEVEGKLSDSWLKGIDPEFKKYLDEWTNLNLKAIEIFREKDFQGILF